MDHVALFSALSGLGLVLAIGRQQVNYTGQLSLFTLEFAC